MSFTRNFLKSAGLNDDQISAVIEEHNAVVEALKQQRDAFKADAEKLAEAEKQLSTLRANSGDDWRSKYETLKGTFDEYRAETTAREKSEKIRAAYAQLLKDANIDSKRIDAILRVTDMTGMELGEDGHLADADKLTEGIKSEWGAFVQSTGTKGATVETPPTGSGTRGGKTREEILAIPDTAERQRAIADNHELFGI